MGIRFHKMHGLGNDFVVIDTREPGTELPPERRQGMARRLADRRYGIGCDQSVFLHPSRQGDVYMQIFNADGGEVDACGNATRCVAWLEMERTGKEAIVIETHAGLLEAQRRAPTLIRVDMGMPRCDWQDIPLAEAMDTLHIPHGLVGLPSGVAVNMGNPHLVMFVDDVSAVPLQEVGAVLEHSPLFPERVNVTIAQVTAPDRITMKTWERGAGETLACGTAACATMVAARRRDLVETAATLTLPGGELTMAWAGDEQQHGQPVLMTGAIAHVFTGELSESA